jgi:hypothetical protein
MGFTKINKNNINKAWKPAKEELETINMGNEEIKRELKIRIVITPKEKEELIAPLRDYVDVFTWSYKDMLGLHRVPLVEGCKSVKQRLRMTNPNVLIKVKAEIE